MHKGPQESPDIYLCGPMTGLPEANLKAFAEAERFLTRVGYSVFNPGAIQSPDMTFEQYMRPELQVLLNTKKALVALPGWQAGVGARLEVMVANSIGLTTVEYSPTMGLGKPLAISGDDARARVADLMARPQTSTGVDAGEDKLPHMEAAELVLGPRGDYYDHPYDNFQRTAHMWTGILYSKLREGETIDPEEVSLCMVALKLAREAFRHKRDNVIDGHGYLITHMMVLERLEELKNMRQVGGSDDDFLYD
jgi:hypothetical protein